MRWSIGIVRIEPQTSLIQGQAANCDKGVIALAIVKLLFFLAQNVTQLIYFFGLFIVCYVVVVVFLLCWCSIVGLLAFSSGGVLPFVV